MIKRFTYLTLEHVISEQITIDALCDQKCKRLAHFRVADYVSDYRLGNPLASKDPSTACARFFFADNGPFLTQVDGRTHGREYSISFFGTFVVVEFNIFTPEAHFLVLAPSLPGQDPDAPYAGLWAAQKVERLLNECDVNLFEELDSLVDRLNQPLPAGSSSKKSIWKRLFKH